MIYLVEKWKLALKEFLKKYEEDEMVVGAILCGSYANDTYNDSSDIDVCLVLGNDVSYEERGNVDSNSYLIEYFMYPKQKYKEYMEVQYNKGRMPLINMVAYGKIIYDLDGSVKELQNLALDYIDRPFNNIKADKLDMNNYHLWDNLDELKRCLKENDPNFNLIYYNLLGEVYDYYSEYLSIPKLPNTKIYKILTDEDFRRRYHVFKLPENEFIRLYIKCFELQKPDIMYKNIEELINYYYKRQGGFNIRGFKLKTELKEEDL